MTTKFCPYCNFPVGEGDTECPNCGFSLSDADSTQVFNAIDPNTTLPHKAAKSSNYPELAILKGPLSGQSFVLNSPEIIIGRDPACSIFLNDRTVSRRHALITLRGADIILEDLGSLNGTWVDNAIITSVKLQNESVIQIGTFQMSLKINPKG